MLKLEEEARKFMQDRLVIKEVMTADFYEERASLTAIYPKEKSLEYLALGLTSEAGEVAGKVKKLIRDGKGDKKAIASEIGDVLWYCAMLAKETKVSLNDIMKDNLKKLYSRKERGTLQGSGDNR
jgi:NTP pyrophosphatase (non-canonical NTP hydrolase)